ncbi:MAG: S41 family peptidase, partial [Patescibacteria group bacterium]
AEPERKQKYDSFGIEPTILYRLIKPNILHLRITRFSPTTLDEFQKATEAVDKGEILDTLILDLRNNIGGAIDAMPYFLGPFIGKDQYAYEYYRQGEREPYKTVVGWLPSLVRYKKVIILIDDKAQSSAELMAASLKKYNVGVTVGVPTKGWGTIERVFELENQISPAEIYSMFLVHTITLRDDGEPIEGRGVEPLINVQDPSWTKELYKYFNSNEIVSVVKQLWDEGVE